MKNKNSIKWFWLIITIIWTGVILSFSFQTAEVSSGLSKGILSQILAYINDLTGITIQISTVHNLFRKLAHFTEFFILGTVASLYIESINKKAYYVIIYGFLIAFSDELTQFITSAGRAMRFTDMLIDTTGVCVAVLIVWVFKTHKNKQLHR